MRDEDKSKEQLLTELRELRERLSEREMSEGLMERRSRKALDEIQELIESVIESFPESIVVINSARKIIWMNRKARDFLVGSASPPKSLLCYQCYHRRQSPCDGVEFDCPSKKVRESGKVLSLIHEHYRSDGEKRILEIIASPLFSKEGSFQGIVEIERDVTDHRKADEEREKLIGELQEALSKIKTLKGLIPICAWCKKIRDDKGYWTKVETYIREHSDASFTHGICPECLKKVSPETYNTVFKTDTEDKEKDKS